MKLIAKNLAVFQWKQPGLAAKAVGFVLFLLAPIASAASSDSKRVLILNSFNSDAAPFGDIASAFKSELVQQSPRPVEFHEAAVETARFEEPEAELAFAKYLRALYSRRPPDLVVPVGGPAAQFWWRQRDGLFPTTPAVIAGIDQRVLRSATLTSNETAVVGQLNLPALVDVVLQVLPETTNIAVVIGNSPLERFWVAECREAWRPFTNRVQFSWFNELSIVEIRRRIAQLPPRSAVGYGMLTLDAAGVPHEPMETLDQLCAQANAPVFGLLEEQLGRGIVGGRLFPVGTLGREAAHVAARILAGEEPDHIATSVLGVAPPVFDWRELQRWHIEESRLPGGSVVRFRQPSLWERYRWYIVGAAALVALQSLTIAGLLAHRARLRRAEADLREHQQFMELATAAGGLGLWVLGVPGGELWVNPRLRSLFGFPVDAAVRLEDILARIHPDDRARAELAWQGAVVEGRSFELEGRLVLPDGTQRWVAARGLAAKDARGRVSRTEGAVFDITARREAAERARLVLEAAPYAMIMADQQGHISLVNATAETMFGYARDELIGQSVDVLVPEPSRSRHAEQCRGFMANGTSRLMGQGRDLFARRKDGVQVPVEIRLSPIATPQGRFVLASILDLTARREAETAVQRHRSELRHISRVHVLGQLSSALAHELNQPLGAILSNTEAAELFLEGKSPALSEIRAILGDIRKDDQRASDVIRRMRALLQRHELEPVPLSAAELVEDSIALTRPDALVRRVSVECVVQPAMPPVRGDRVHLEQVLLNLLLNGMDAVRDCSTERRRLLVRAQRGGDHYIEFSVRDFGRGIAPDQLDHIFESFYTTKPNGLGLGLSISRTIIEAHHGRIWAENTPDGGASFRFTLPTVESQE